MEILAEEKRLRFERLVVPHRDALYGFAMTLTRDADEAGRFGAGDDVASTARI